MQPGLIISAGTASLTLSLYALHWSYSTGQDSLHITFSHHVPSIVLWCQMASFAAVLALNVVNLSLCELSRFRSSCNWLLLYVNGVVFVGYLFMCTSLTPLAHTTNGRLFFPLHYLLWMHTTPVMIYMLSLTCDVSRQELVVVLLNNVSMILSGLAGTVISGSLRLVNCVLSFVCFGVVVHFFIKLRTKVEHGPGDVNQRRELRSLLLFTAVLWTAFPLLWLLAQAQLVSLLMEQLCWGACDFLAKVVLSTHVWHGSLVSLSQRRKQAMRVLEKTTRSAVMEKLCGSLAAKERLMHAFTHEIRKPIQSIFALTSSICELPSARCSRLQHTSGGGGSSGGGGGSSAAREAGGSAQDAPADKALAVIRSTTSCVLNMVNTILDDAAAKDGVAVTDKRMPHALAPLVEEIIDVLSPLASEGVTIVNALSTDLPMVKADLNRLQRVFYSLIANAIRFTHEGCVRISAHMLIADGASDLVEVTVSDTGIGIPQAKLSALFKPFGQPDDSIAFSTSSGGSGGGMRLYLVKIALAALDSTITVSSMVNKGTTFRFTLPTEASDRQAGGGGTAVTAAGGDGRSGTGTAAAVAAVDHVPAELRGQRGQGTGGSGGGGHGSGGSGGPPLLDRAECLHLSQLFDSSGGEITSSTSSERTSADMATRSHRTQSLLARVGGLMPALEKGVHRMKHGGQLQVLSVDDDQVYQLLAEQALASMNWKVVKAMDGHQALAYIKDVSQCLPDLVLLDIDIPGLKGYEVCGRIREVYPSSLLPIIMVSRRAGEQGVVEALEVGADDYLSKPYRRLELAARITAHVRARDSTWKLNLRLLQMMRQVESLRADAAGERTASEPASRESMDTSRLAYSSTTANGNSHGTPGSARPSHGGVRSSMEDVLAAASHSHSNHSVALTPIITPEQSSGSELDTERGASPSPQERSGSEPPPFTQLQHIGRNAGDGYPGGGGSRTGSGGTLLLAEAQQLASGAAEPAAAVAAQPASGSRESLRGGDANRFVAMLQRLGGSGGSGHLFSEEGGQRNSGGSAGDGARLSGSPRESPRASDSNRSSGRLTRRFLTQLLPSSHSAAVNSRSSTNLVGLVVDDERSSPAGPSHSLPQLPRSKSTGRAERKLRRQAVDELSQPPSEVPTSPSSGSSGSLRLASLIKKMRGRKDRE